jgi:hypothetical protein
MTIAQEIKNIVEQLDENKQKLLLEIERYARGGDFGLPLPDKVVAQIERNVLLVDL